MFDDTGGYPKISQVSSKFWPKATACGSRRARASWKVLSLRRGWQWLIELLEITIKIYSGFSHELHGDFSQRTVKLPEGRAIGNYIKWVNSLFLWAIFNGIASGKPTVCGKSTCLCSVNQRTFCGHVQWQMLWVYRRETIKRMKNTWES